MKRKVTFTLDENILTKIDNKRGLVSRSVYLQHLIKGALK